MKFFEINHRILNASYIREISYEKENEPEITFILEGGESITVEFDSSHRRAEELHHITQFLGGGAHPYPNQRQLYKSYFYVLPWHPSIYKEESKSLKDKLSKWLGLVRKPSIIDVQPS